MKKKKKQFATTFTFVNVSTELCASCDMRHPTDLKRRFALRQSEEMDN